MYERGLQKRVSRGKAKKISISELEELTYKAVKSYGYRDDEVRIISEVLLYAQLRDNNQGMVKLIGKGIPRDPRLPILNHAFILLLLS